MQNKSAEAPSQHETDPATNTLAKPLSVFASQHFLLVGLFFLAFSLTAFIIQQYARTVNPFPYIGMISEKIQYLEKHGSDIDVVFLGASSYRGAIYPPVLDSAMTEYGCSLKSFNFGVDGLNIVESMFIMEQLHKLRPNRLPRLVVDLPIAHYGDGFEATRTRFFNSWTNFPVFLRDIWHLPHSKTDRLAIFVQFFHGFAYEQSSVGKLYSLAFPVKMAAEKAQENHAFRGYAIPDEIKRTEDDIRSLTQQAMTTIEKLNTLYGGSHYTEKNGQGNARRIRPLLKKAQELGFKVGVMFVPSVGRYAASEPLRKTMTAMFPDISMWHYNNLDRWPTFFDGRYLVNVSHLNHTGALAFSRLLAPDLCHWVSRRQ